MIKTIFACVSLFLISGCATLFGASAQDQWDKQTQIYNVVAEKMIELREPCVTQGSDAPGCILGDELFSEMRIVQKTADGYLKAAEVQIAAGEESDAKFYLRNAAGALLSLSDQLGLKTPELEE